MENDLSSLVASLPPGRPFAAVAAVEGVVSRDNELERVVTPGAIRLDQVPFPLLFSHDRNSVIGRVDKMYPMSEADAATISRALQESPDLLNYDPERVFIAEGYFAATALGVEKQELVEARMLRGTSVGPGQLVRTEDEEIYTTGRMEMTDFQVVELSVASVAAIGPCCIWMSDVPYSNEAPETTAREEEFVTASLQPLTAQNDFELLPPDEFFTKEGLPSTVPDRLTVTKDGRVYGMLARFGKPHVGFTDTYVTVPIEDGHDAFHIKTVRTASGEKVRCGVLTMRTAHAGPKASAAETVAHYDNTGYAIADVVIIDTGYGYAMTGAVRTTATPEDIRALEGSNISGDWRKDMSVRRLRLRAVLAVNVPGYPPTHFHSRSDSLVEFSVSGSDALVASFTSQVPSETEKLRMELEAVQAELLSLKIDRDLQA